MTPMDIVIGILSWIALAIGGAFVLIGGIGMLRLPDFYTRVHAAGVTDTLGAGLVLLGLILQAGFTLVTFKLFLILFFLLFTGPTAAHALAKAAMHGGVKPREGETERRS